MSDIRTIKTEEEFVSICEEIRNRQYEPNPVIVDVYNIIEHIEPYDWDVEYLKITKVDNSEIVELIKY